MRKCKRLSETDKATLWDLYFNKKLSSEVIAKQLQVSGPAIRATIRRMGGTVRGAIESHRSKPLNEHVFDTLTPESSYWLGVLMTDGCVYDDKNPQSSPRIELQWKNVDAEHIKAFDTFMGGGSRISVKVRPKGVYHRWDARSVHLANTLKSYGVSPRKTKTACPTENLKWNPDFWRGCIDGDGEVDEGNNCPAISLVGSFPLIQAFCDYVASICPEYPLKARPSGHTNCTAYINLYGHGGMTLLRVLYKDNLVSMPRKNSKAQGMLIKYGNRDFRILKPDIHQRSTFPYTYTDLDKAHKDFTKLSSLDARTLVKQLVKGAATSIETSVIVKDKTGMYASHLFNESVRMQARVKGKQSPMEMWDDPEQREKIIYEAENRKHSSLRASMSANCRPCWGFLPAVAKAVYQHFHDGPEPIHILDPCAGWGDRLTASLSLPNLGSYTGYDPNIGMSMVYERIKNCYAGKSDVKISTLPFEDASVPENVFDIAFTSPPYFDYEEYSQDAGQSFKRYATADDWRRGFLFPLIKKCASGVKSKCVVAINISDIGENKLVDWLIAGASEVPELQFIGTLFMQTGNFDRDHEGIYCWRKK